MTLFDMLWQDHLVTNLEKVKEPQTVRVCFDGDLAAGVTAKDMMLYLITLNFEMERKREGKPSNLMDLLITKDWKSMFNSPDVRLE